jgi:hypothetical protein
MPNFNVEVLYVWLLYVWNFNVEVVDWYVYSRAHNFKPTITHTK